MYFKWPLMIFLSIIFLVSACTLEHSKIVVAEFGDNKITMDDFENAYSKNFGSLNDVKSDSIDAYKKFLDLYVNYKLKLRDAFVRGYTEDPDIQNEIKDYKTNIGSTLYLENVLYEPGMKQLFERRKWELRASHIFITPDSNRTMEQCVELEKKLIDSLKLGRNFAELAKKYSKDPNTSAKGGDVYYFTGGQIAAPALEDAVYNTPVGQVYPEPVFSGYGYHIIKITDKCPRRPMISAQHILISLRDSTGKPLQDTIAAYQKILEIKNKIDNGADFGELAKEYSADKGSADKNGDLGFFARGRMVREFDEAAFKLKKDEVSPIIRSQFGYHIIKLTDEKPLATFDEDKESLREMYKKYKYNFDFNTLIEKLKKELNFVEDSTNVNTVVGQLDSLVIGPDYWTGQLQKQIGNLVLFSFMDQKFVTDSLIADLQKIKNNAAGKIDANSFKQVLTKYEGDQIIKYKGLHYEKESTEFTKLMDEYENGVYLFKILENEVWSKVSVDTNMVKEYWEKNKAKFSWNDRVEYNLIFEQKDSLANNVYNELTKGTDFDRLAVISKKQNSINQIPVNQGFVDVNTDELSKEANLLKKIGDYSKPFPYKGGWSIVKLVQREPSRLKTLDEVKAEIAGILQESESKKLENEYIAKLWKLYKPKIYYDELQNAFKK